MSESRKRRVVPAEDSLSLKGMLRLARGYAKGAKGVDRRRMRITVGPCPECGIYDAHVHTPEVQEPIPKLEKRFQKILYRTLIVVERYNLFLPRRLQEWLMMHEMAHAHCPYKPHNAKQFIDAEKRMMPDADRRLNQYHAFVEDHWKQLDGLSRELFRLNVPAQSATYRLRRPKKRVRRGRRSSGRNV